MNPVRFSIAMATYNGARFLEQQLDSLAAQELLPAELIVGDDGSTDGTEDVVRDFAARAPFPVHFERNASSLGYGENFIRTALRCTGDWIAFCDQDDVWSPEKLNYCAEQIATGPDDLCLIAHNAECVDERLQPLGALYEYPEYSISPPLQLPPEWYCLGLTQVFRASLIRDIPPDRRVSFPWHDHRHAHDVWIALIANATGSICRTNRLLAMYRRHAATVTQRPATPDPAWRRLTANHGNQYRERAVYLRDAAETLGECARSATPAVRAKLTVAITKIELQAGFFDLRASIYDGPTRARRMSAARKLIAAGGYIGKAGWPFGVQRLFKDLSYAALGRNSSSPPPLEEATPRSLRGGGLLGLIRAGELRPVHDKATSDYRPDIDGLRAIAVIAVMLFHGGLSGFPGGFVGVDIFFVISGFLIGRIVLSQVAAGSFSLLSFYDRRVRRIIPPLLATIAGTLVMAYFLLLPAQFEGLGYEVLAATAFVSNIWFWRQTGYFHPESDIQPLLHSWSLSIEEQFYLIFPAMIVVAFLVSRRAAITGVMAVLLLSFALSSALVAYVPSAAFFLLPTRAWELLVGVLLAASLVKAPRTPALANGAGIVGLLLMTGAILWFDEAMPFPGVLAAIPVAGAALFIWAGATRCALSRALSARPLVFVGLISYSLYLWHWPVYVAARHHFATPELTGLQAAGCMLLATLMAIVSVRYVEAPFRDRRTMPARRAYPILGTGLALVCAAAAMTILSVGAPGRFSAAKLRLAAGAKDFSPVGERCRNLAIDTAWRDCRIGAEGEPSFLLWGDSHAAALTPAIAWAAARAGRTGVLIESDGCFPVLGLSQDEMTRSDRDRCRVRTRELARFLVAHPELRTVVMTARWYRGERYDAAPLSAALGQTVAWLSGNGRDVMVIAGLPVPEGDVPWRLATASNSGRTVEPFIHPYLEGALYQRVRQLAREGRLRSIMLAPALCRGEHCRASFDGRSLFTDDNHLSAFAAERLVAPYLERAGLFAAPRARP